MSRLDPQIRPEVRDKIMDYLYTKDAEGAYQILMSIIDEHCKITGQSLLAIMFFGKVYKPQHAPNQLIAPPLHESLHDRMWAYVKDRQVVEREEKLIIKNLLTAVLNTSDSLNDWMRILPPAVHPPLQYFIDFRYVTIPPPILTDAEVEAFQNKQERFLNMLKGRLALNLIF